MNNEQVKVKCIGMDEEGKGIVKIRGQEFHVPDLIEGETAFVGLQRKKNYTAAKVLRIEEKSAQRVKPRCQHFDRCGGCQLQHLSEEGQADFKQKRIEELLSGYHQVSPILTMANPYHYRNKVHSTVSYDDKGRQIISGIYEERTHRVIPIEQCLIQDKEADQIITTIREIMKKYKMQPYNEDTGAGFLRHILIKTGFVSKQVMVVLVVASQMFAGKKNFVDILLKKHPQITTIVMNVNNQRTSMVLGNVEKVLYGKGYIEDTLCGCVFQISPRSFYQINPLQTEILYGKAMELAGLKGNEVVLDVYSGIGTIALIVSSKVKKVIGVELNKHAVKDAINNAERNNITNASFYNDDAGDFIVNLAQEIEKIDTVFMDPPRGGSDEKFLASLVRLAPRQVIYISCNPVTQERDLRYLTRHGYTVTAIQPVDMFPQTFHVECIVRVEKK